MRSTLLLLLMVGATLSGCLGTETPIDLGESATHDPAAEPPRDSPSPQEGERSPPQQQQPQQQAPPMRAWAPLEEATIRPGVQLVSETGQCTSNFVFASPDNATLYLGFAAHCVEGLEPGARIDIANGAATGTLAYSSWHTMEQVKEEDGAAWEDNDFALVQIPEEARHLVHPAMRHYGGPTALADSSGVRTGEKVLTYGNSGLRGQIEPLSWHEGYVLSRANAWSTTVYTATPGIPGDSGSGVMTGDGRALGILVTLTIAPAAGSNGVTHLDTALHYASEHAGVDARLVTWELLEPGLLPQA